jgi:hypothetical protein
MIDKIQDWLFTTVNEVLIPLWKDYPWGFDIGMLLIVFGCLILGRLELAIIFAFLATVFTKKEK